MSWREWFKVQNLIGGYHNSSEEARYQAYKARLIEELAVSAPDLRTMAVLVDRSES